MTVDNTAPHIYCVSLRGARFVLAAALAALGLGLAASYAWPGPPSIRVVVGLLLAASSLYSAYSAAVTRLTLSAEGIEYRGVTGITAASWDQVNKIRRVSNRRGGQYFELVLANSRRRIRLSDFDLGADGSSGPVAVDLRLYASRLFKPD